MGAQWIHGKNGNAIYEIAHSNGFINESAPDYIDALCNINVVGSAEELTSANNLFKYLQEKLENMPENLDENLSVSDYLSMEFQKFLKQYDMPDLLKGVFDMYCKCQCELNGCADLSTLSLSLLNQYNACEGPQTVELKYGYSSILKVLTAKIPENSLLLNKEVKCINWNNFKNSVRIKKCESSLYVCGSSDSKNLPKIEILCSRGETYEADHVICTCSLGYLKKYVKTLFSPPLPESKFLALQSVGFGTVNKIYFEFSEPFWEPAAIYHVIWTSSLYDIFNQELLKDSRHWVFYVNRFAYTPGHPLMLCAWIVGEGAIEMENIPECEISFCCMVLLQRILNQKLPKPERVVRSAWHSDPHMCGSYSYLTMESDNKSNLIISEPIFSDAFSCKHPILQFAGEATHPYYFSTVHGAYESGLREATLLSDHYRLNKPFTVKDAYRNMRIAIVGAGIAGLSTAYALYQMGFTQVTVLEASEQPGGRILTHYEDNLILDLGAQWIHGTDNSLYEYAKDHNILCDVSDEPSCEGKGTFYTSHGYIIEQSVVKEMKTLVENSMIKLKNHEYSLSETSAQKYFIECYNQHVSLNCVNPLDLVRKGVFEWFLKYEVIDNSCDNLDQMSLDCYTDWCDIAEEMYHINVNNGFHSLIDTILSEIPCEWLCLKKPVISINWGRESIPLNYICLSNRLPSEFPVLLECEDGENINADIVVMTASVGFMKENLGTFFKPSLPKEKSVALSNIGFGAIEKIFLIFEKQFWGKDLGFQLVWIEPLDEELKLLLKENSWIVGITGFDIVRKQPNVLLGWIGGKEAKLLENIETETIANTCTHLLRKFLKCPDIPFPVKFFRSEWNSKKYVKGAYSFRSCKFHETNSTLFDLKSPLNSAFLSKNREQVKRPTVLFAGEAMNETSFSSVHGAYQTGVEAANHIKNISNQYME